MKKLLRKTLIVMLSLVGFLLIVAMVLLAKPSLVLNTRLLNFSLDYLNKKQIASVKTKSASLNVSSFSFLHKRIVLSVDRLEFKRGDFSGVVPRLYLDAEFTLNHATVSLARLNQIYLFIESLVLIDARTKKPSEYLGNVNLFNNKLVADLRERNTRMRILSDVNIRDRGFSGPISLQIPGSVFLEGKTDYTVVDSNTGMFDLSLSGNIARVPIFAKLRGERKNWQIESRTSGHFGNQSWQVGWHQDTCEIGLHIYDQMKLGCAIDFPITSLKKYIDWKVSKLLPLVKIKVRAQLDKNVDDLWDGKGAVDFESPDSSPLSLGGHVAATLVKSPLNADLIKNLRSDFQLKFDVVDFAAITKVLALTPVAVPAPLNVLAGGLSCAVNGKFSGVLTQIPFSCETALRSPQQKVFMQAAGLLEGSPLKLQVDVNLNDIQLVLPRFGIRDIPPIFPDGRIAKIRKQIPALQYDVHIFARPRALRLASSLTSSPVPLGLDMRVNSQSGLGGFIALDETKLDLFRRQATLQNLKIEFTSKSRKDIHGLIDVNYTDYVIKIVLLGTMEKPIVRFESEPPLKENEILSVLLFGQGPEELDIGQTESVANTRNALQEKAIALSSMYLLATTPIENINYNSASEVFTAKVRIAKGTSFNIGATSQEVRELGVKRHIKGPWYIHTYLRNPASENVRSTMAVLEWVSRF